jgi:Rrf2 family protein
MRLDLTKRADYAIRAMLALANASEGERLSARQIAAAQGIPAQILPRIMSDLGRAGLVVSVAGRTGGYELARARASVSLLDVIQAVEGDAHRRTCVLRGGACRFAGVCDVHDAFYAAQDALLSSLSGATLETLRRGEPA